MDGAFEQIVRDGKTLREELDAIGGEPWPLPNSVALTRCAKCAGKGVVPCPACSVEAHHGPTGA